MTNQSRVENYKITELGPLPAEWRVVRLGEVAKKMKAGGTPRRSNPEYWKGNIPFVKIEDISKAGLFLHTSQLTISQDGLNNSSAWIVPPGTLLLTMYGTIGKIAINTIPVATNQAILAIIPKPDMLDALFGAYLIQFHAPRLERENVQSTQKNVSKQIIERFKVPLPPLPEQRAIAHVLRAVQRAKEATEGVIAAARELKKSLMRHLFTYGPVPIGAQGLAPLQETEIGPLPAHWRVVRLGEVAYKPQYGYTASAAPKPVGPKFLRITDIQNGRVYWPNVPFCAIQDDLLNKYRLKEGDVLFARIGATTGKTYLVTKNPHAVFASYLIRVRTHSNQLLPDYLYFFTHTSQYWQQINATKGGRLKQGINIPVLTALRIPLPPIDEQREIARILQTVDHKIEAEEARKEALEGLFKTLLHHLMTAKVRLPREFIERFEEN